MPKVNTKKQEEPKKSYNPSPEHKETIDFLSTRISDLKEFRSSKLLNNTKSIEDIWREADAEYQPHELTSNVRKTLVSEEDGTAARFVKLGQEEGWQSNQASPDFYVKVNTALSILVDQNPEAVFLPAGKKYEKNTALAYANWKNSWEVSGAKQQIKNFIFNMSKYGTGYLRTYPKRIELEKSIRTEYYPDQPEKDVYEKKTIVKYNDLCRESMNPWQVWLGEMARPGSYESIDEWYFEKDYSIDAFKQAFEDYPDAAFACEGQNEGEEKTPVKSVTVGFYENDKRDIYAIWIPSVKILIYQSPLPNDDGMLSVITAPWTLRDDRCPYGIGLWEIIRNDSVLYDRLMNMSMDQLVLSIYKMAFYQGTTILGENGQLIIRPGGMEQTANASAITFLEVPGPGGDSWRGLQYLQDRKDNMSGVTQQLSGRFAGKTLGQDVQAKESALERMKSPLDYILDALQQEAFISLSWQKQILSTPEILEYTDLNTLQGALKEMGLADEEITKYLQEANSPQQGTSLVFGSPPDEAGNQRKFANVYRESQYGLEQDDKGELIESKKNQFYRFGLDLPLHRLEWRGIIRIKPQSVLAPSKELTKRMKLDLFNLTYPAIQGMLAQPQNIPILLPPIKQIVKVYEEDSSDWFNEEELMSLAEAAKQPPPASPPEQPRISISVKFEDLSLDVQSQVLQKYAGIEPPKPPEVPLFVDKNAQPGQPTEQPTGSPEFSPLVPRGTLTGGGQPGAAMSKMVSEATQTP